MGVDGSPSSQNAVRWAAHDAALRGVPLTLVHAVERSRFPPSSRGVVEEWAHREARGILRDADELARAQSDGGLEIRSVVASESAAAALVAASRPAVLTVVGRRGHGGLVGVHPGSVSSDVVRHALSAVVLVHDDHSVTDTDDGAPVLVGVSLDDTSDRALDIAFDEAALRGVGVVALHSCSAADGVDELEHELLQAAVDHRLRPWRGRYPSVAVRIVVAGDDEPARQLGESVEDPQLIVVGDRRRGRLVAQLRGSVSQSVARVAHVPVAVAHLRHEVTSAVTDSASTAP